MPINGPASYLPTTDEFIAHWAAANTALGAAGPIVLMHTYTQANLVTLRTELEDIRAEIESLRNGREGARAVVEELKAGLLLRLNQFNSKLASMSPDSKWTAMLPKAFTQSAAMGRVIPPLDDVEDIWQRYETDVEDVTLMGGYSRVNFATALADLKQAYKDLTSADNALGIKRGERTEKEAQIHPILKAYRARIPAEFPEGSAIFETLPRLSPLPGSTPDPVAGNGVFNEATNEADLSWTESTAADLERYEVRGVAGPEYEADDEVILATVPAGGERVFSTSYALTAPGTSATFKIYVITATGNERGSNAVTVTRPS